MLRGTLVTAVLFGLSSPMWADTEPNQEPAVATFRSSVAMVRVSAVVRDRKGRFVQNLSAGDFEVLDAGSSKPIADFRHDVAGVSVALLFDISGSMEGQIATAREAATHLLGWLDEGRDEAAVFTFDTQLDEVAPFTRGLQELPTPLEVVRPFGATSLHDAIAETSERLEARQGRRRAVVVFTDGRDNASRRSPAQVSAVASAIDVPVYIVGIVSAIDNPSADITAVKPGGSALAEDLANLAAWTGGHVFVASTPAERSASARSIVDELRHQYLIAFESSGAPGWRPLEVRARSKDLIVRARSGYFAGQSRPIS
jgi:Ca-activated chloride channel family protein